MAAIGSYAEELSRSKKGQAQFLDRILKFVDEDHEYFLKGLRKRINRVGMETPKIEVRYENLSVEGNVYVGHRAIPSLFNTTFNSIQSAFGLIGVIASKKKKVKILESISGIIKPSRLTLLLGPPGAGKSTLLLALAGKLDNHLKVSGNVSYCGHQLFEFIPQRTCAYISPHNLHSGEMTVRETLDFSGRCLGARDSNLLTLILKMERELRIETDSDIDAFMKATTVQGQETSLVTNYILKILGLETCADAMVGDQMIRGISGGEKKRVTTGEMLVGPARVLFMDEISNGLDSATTYHIIKVLRQMVHIMDLTMVISLLQPDPETYKLFDDVILMSEGQIVYQGPCQNVVDFFECMGFKCPERKGVADFLQEVTSQKDQQQYWFKTEQAYRYISVSEFSQAFKSYHIGEKLETDIKTPYNKSKTHPDALVKDYKYGISNLDLLKVCFYKEWLLTKRNYLLYIFKTFQLTFMSLVSMAVFFRTEMHVGHLEDGGKFFGSLFFALLIVMFNGMAELVLTVMRLPVFYRHRDALLYPAWAFALPIWVLRIPLSFMESGIWVILTYYTIGYAPDGTRFFKQFLTFFAIHQMALSLFRLIAAVARTEVLANTLGAFTLLLILVLGGFIVPKDDTQPWMSWGFYASPMMYAQNALVTNEFLDDRWNVPNVDPRINASTIGEAILKSRSFFTKDYWFYISIGVLISFSFLFNILFILALTFLNPFRDAKTATNINESDVQNPNSKLSPSEGSEMMVSTKQASTHGDRLEKRGMVLPFQPLSLVFNHVNYTIDMPVEMKAKGVKGDGLQLLKDVGGAFRPGILTALVGVSGAGKTTLMDVLAGRKSGGCIQGDIFVSGYPKNQATFARVSGYCEQNDIHSPNVTVYESLMYSAYLRLSSDVNATTRKVFVEELMELMELNPISDGLVNGLSNEERKRLTIGVELVANPSIIFMDEPTSGLDARAAAIVMRTVRNTVDTGRTVVCTIHQPSIDIFESFDELILMKTGGQIIYAGPLGQQSQKLVQYFEAISGVTKIREGYNPATWVLEVTSSAVENQFNIDYAEIFLNSSLYQENQQLIGELISTPSKNLFFESEYAQPFLVQCKACLWKQHLSYWRNPQYNVTRFVTTLVIAVIFGLVFFNKGQKMEKHEDLVTMLGALYASVVFLGAINQNAVQPIVSVERTVFYRERAAGMYSSLPYALAQVTIEWIYIATQTSIYVFVLYWMIGFERTTRKMLWFYFYMLMSNMYFTMFGMMTMSLTPTPQISAVFIYFFLCLWNLFSGFIIPRPKIPIWSRWCYWVTPLSWTIYGLLTSQVSGGNTEVKLYMKQEFGFDCDFLPVVAVAHAAWFILFFCIFVCGIKYLNFQKR